MASSRPPLKNTLFTSKKDRSFRSVSSLSSNEAATTTNMSNLSKSKDSLDPETEMASWYACGLPRPEVRRLASDMVEHGPVGCFLVRDVQSEPGAFGLSVKSTDGTLVNFLILRNKSGKFHLKGTKTTFDSLSKLVHYYGKSLRPALGIKLVFKPEDYLGSDSDDDGLNSSDGAKKKSSKKKASLDSKPKKLSKSSLVGDDVRITRENPYLPPKATYDTKLSDSERWALNAHLETLDRQKGKRPSSSSQRGGSPPPAASSSKNGKPSKRSSRMDKRLQGAESNFNSRDNVSENNGYLDITPDNSDDGLLSDEGGSRPRKSSKQRTDEDLSSAGGAESDSDDEFEPVVKVNGKVHVPEPDVIITTSSPPTTKDGKPLKSAMKKGSEDMKEVEMAKMALQSRLKETELAQAKLKEAEIRAGILTKEMDVTRSRIDTLTRMQSKKKDTSDEHMDKLESAIASINASLLDDLAPKQPQTQPSPKPGKVSFSLPTSSSSSAPSLSNPTSDRLQALEAQDRSLKAQQEALLRAQQKQLEDAQKQVLDQQMQFELAQQQLLKAHYLYQEAHSGLQLQTQMIQSQLQFETQQQQLQKQIQQQQQQLSQNQEFLQRQAQFQRQTSPMVSPPMPSTPVVTNAVNSQQPRSAPSTLIDTPMNPMGINPLLASFLPPSNPVYSSDNLAKRKISNPTSKLTAQMDLNSLPSFIPQDVDMESQTGIGLSDAERQKIAFFQQRHSQWVEHQNSKAQDYTSVPPGPFQPNFSGPPKPLTSALRKPSPEKSPPKRVGFHGSQESLNSVGLNHVSPGNSQHASSSSSLPPSSLKHIPEHRQLTPQERMKQSEEERERLEKEAKRNAEMMGVFQIGKVKNLTERFLKAM